ncbi:hypothetical protein HU200_006009 [Digitaria exilis]|uniref:Uncharacterized protein n=1 Tax=Digitaria exilis TaxID=1010633 RepID=A0A835FQZ9_9POAL|nr:hypothetical protein HU200_006009 [Digitaria exilis]
MWVVAHLLACRNVSLGPSPSSGPTPTHSSPTCSRAPLRLSPNGRVACVAHPRLLNLSLFLLSSPHPHRIPPNFRKIRQLISPQITRSSSSALPIRRSIKEYRCPRLALIDSLPPRESVPAAAAMEEDPLIPLVSRVEQRRLRLRLRVAHPHRCGVAAGGVGEGDKENTVRSRGHRGRRGGEIGHIEAEILRLSSRLHHLPHLQAAGQRPSAGRQWSSLRRPREAGGAATDAGSSPPPKPPLSSRSSSRRAAQGLNRSSRLRRRGGRGSSLGPLDIVARIPGSPPPHRRGRFRARPARAGVSLGPLEIHNGVGSKPGSAAAAAAAPVKPFYNKAHNPSSTLYRQTVAIPAMPGSHMKPGKDDIKQSQGKEREHEPQGPGGIAVNKVGDEVKAKGVINQTSNAATSKRPAGSSKPHAWLVCGSWNTREAAQARVADLVGKRSFFTPDMDDGNAITPYQARVLQVESPEAGEEEQKKKKHDTFNSFHQLGSPSS